MTTGRSILVIAFLTMLFAGPAFGATCNVTLPSDSPVHADGAISGGPFSGNAWYGSRDLAALIPKSGHWLGMGKEREYFDKFWWWRAGYDARTEPRPDLVVSARRLDGPARKVVITRVNSGFHGPEYDDQWDSMLVGMTFPTSGCWEVTGTYNGIETIKMIFQVGP